MYSPADLKQLFGMDERVCCCHCLLSPETEWFQLFKRSFGYARIKPTR